MSIVPGSRLLQKAAWMSLIARTFRASRSSASSGRTADGSSPMADAHPAMGDEAKANAQATHFKLPNMCFADQTQHSLSVDCIFIDGEAQRCANNSDEESTTNKEKHSITGRSRRAVIVIDVKGILFQVHTIKCVTGEALLHLAQPKCLDGVLKRWAAGRLRLMKVVSNALIHNTSQKDDTTSLL